jgi:competence protein ComEA
MKNLTKNALLGITAAMAMLAASPALAQTTHGHARASTASHAAPSHAATTHATPSDEADGVVNIQTATAEQLQLLPGIGPSKAEAIIAYRTAHPFQRVEDILRVRGIGRATFRRLRSMITTSGATTMTTDVRMGRRTAAPAASATPAVAGED